MDLCITTDASLRDRNAQVPPPAPASSLADKLALVTGHDHGMGRGVAISFARDGAEVTVAYDARHDDAAEVTTWVERAGRAAIAIACDLAERTPCREVVDAAVSRFGRIDILVCSSLPLDAELAAGSVYVTGSIANLAERGDPRDEAAGAGALYVLTHTLADLLSERGFAATCVAPDRAWASRVVPAHAFDLATSFVPAGRLTHGANAWTYSRN